MARTVDATPPRKRIIPREGLYLSPILNILSKILLNPILAAPAAVALHHCDEYRTISVLLSRLANSLSVHSIASLLSSASLSSLRSSAKSLLYSTITSTSPNTPALIAKILVVCGVLHHANRYLTHWARNNWVTDPTWDWEKEIVLITGGATKRGFGGLMAQDFSRRGIRCVVLDIEKLEYEANELIHYYKCDVGNPEEIDSVAEQIKREVGDPTVIINNAGLARGLPLTSTNTANINLTFSVNILSQFHMLRHFLPSLVRRNHGHVVTIASASAFSPPPEIVDYAASKAATIALHDGLSTTLRHAPNRAPRVRTTLVVPSFARTPIFAGETNHPWFVTPLLEPETVAEAVVEQVLMGVGRDCYLPGFVGVMPWVRAMPFWFQIPFLDAAAKTKVNYVGRQKMDSKGRQLASD